MDNIDRKIIETLQRDGRLTNLELLIAWGYRRRPA